MTDLPSGPWVVISAAIPSIGSAAWVLWKWWAERHDKAAESELNAEERQLLHLEKERQSLSSGQQQLFENLSGENGRLRGELADTRKDRDRGWNFARRCERRMNELFHSLMNARTMVDTDREHSNKPPMTWPVEAPLPTDQDFAA